MVEGRYRVTLEVTRDGWTWSVYNGTKVIATRSMYRDHQKRGFKSTEKAVVFEEALNNFPDLLVSIERESPMDICNDILYQEDSDDASNSCRFK